MHSGVISFMTSDSRVWVSCSHFHFGSCHFLIIYGHVTVIYLAVISGNNLREIERACQCNITTFIDLGCRVTWIYVLI